MPLLRLEEGLLEQLPQVLLDLLERLGVDLVLEIASSPPPAGYSTSLTLVARFAARGDRVQTAGYRIDPGPAYNQDLDCGL